MHEISHSAILPYSREDLFNLVNDIENYPEFLPHCTRTKIHEVFSEPNGLEKIKASIFLKKGPFSHSFTTENICHFPHKIELSLIEGPFKSFQGEWEFILLHSNTDPIQQACKVNLKLKFEIENSLLNQAFAKLFENIANKMLDAFCHRADELYKNQLNKTP